MKITGSLLVGYDFSSNGDVPVLIVGRKKAKESVEVINAFQGEEAVELFKKLTERKGNMYEENSNII